MSASAPLRRIRRPQRILRKAAEFEAVLRSGGRISSQHFVFRAASNGRAHARLGIIAGRKAAPRAVDRNRLKRLIRESFNHHLERLGQHDVTIQVKSALRAVDNEAVRAELNRALEHLARRLAPAEPGGARRP